MDKRTCKRAAKKLVDELVNGIKTISNKNVKEEEDRYVVEVPLGETLPTCSFSKQNFDLKAIEKIKQGAWKTVTNLSTLEEMIEKDFKVKLNTGENVDFFITLTLTPPGEMDHWTFQIGKSHNGVNVVLSPIPEAKYSSEIADVLPKKTDFHYNVLFTNHSDAKSVLLKIIDATREFYEELVKKCDERLEFLKQPIEKFEHLTQPVQSHSPNAVPRYLKYVEWKYRLYDALRDVLDIPDTGESDVKRIANRQGSTLKLETEKAISKKLKAISEVKRLISCFPEIQNSVASTSEDLFWFDMSSGRLFVDVPRQCKVRVDKDREIKMVILPENVQEVKFADWLDFFENALKDVQKRIQTVNVTRKKQKRSKKMIL